MLLHSISFESILLFHAMHSDFFSYTQWMLLPMNKWTLSYLWSNAHHIWCACSQIIRNPIVATLLIVYFVIRRKQLQHRYAWCLIFSASDLHGAAHLSNHYKKIYISSQISAFGCTSILFGRTKVYRPYAFNPLT